MKKFKIVAVILGMSMLLSGCSLNAKATMNNTQEEIKVTEVTGESDVKANLGETAVKAGQRTDESSTMQKRKTPDFVGEVSEIVGNDITVKLVNMPQMAEMPKQDMQKQDQAAQDSTSEEKKSPKAITGSTDSGFPGGGPGGAGFPGGGERGTNKSDTASNAAKTQKRLDLEYTGEEKTISLPVGMSITSGRGGQGVTFETLQKGNVLSIWLDDAENVESVRLINGGTQ